MKNLARKTVVFLAAIAMAATAVRPLPALAWGHAGVFIGVSPIVIGGPLYVPVPRYYAPPPPPIYAPPPYYAPSAPPRPIGFTCYARPYECPLDHPRHLGHPCACLDLNGGATPGTVVH